MFIFALVLSLILGFDPCPVAIQGNVCGLPPRMTCVLGLWFIPQLPPWPAPALHEQNSQCSDCCLQQTRVHSSGKSKAAFTLGICDNTMFSYPGNMIVPHRLRLRSRETWILRGLILSELWCHCMVMRTVTLRVLCKGNTPACGFRKAWASLIENLLCLAKLPDRYTENCLKCG